MSAGKTWLCGPWMGDRAPYEAAETALRESGITPCYGPHDLQAGADPFAFARARIARMADCDTVCLIDGWAGDSVAEFEFHVARRLGIKCTALVVLLSAGA